MLAKVLSLLAITLLCAWTAAPKAQEKSQMLNRATAWKYVSAWAKKVGANVQDLKQGEGGDFFGQLGSLGFDYLAKENMLVVRAYMFAYSASFTSKEDLLPWMNRIATEDPNSVSHGTFETCKPRWELDKEPSLFLRIDMQDGSQSESDVISRLVNFRENSLLWRRNKLTVALDGLVRKRRQERQQQQQHN